VARQVEFDLLVTGTEAGGRKLDRLARKFDDVKDKVDRLDGATARVKGVAKLDKDTDRLGDKLGALGASMLTATASVIRFTSYIGLAAGAAGPLALAVGAVAVSVGQFTAAVLPATAALAPLAAGAVFLKLTFKGMGEEFIKSVEPMTAAWKKQTTAAGKLATQGLRPISREFVKVNFPAIAEAQERIARATNKVVTGFGKWVNSAAGVKVIRRLTGDTSKAFEQLAPSVRSVGQSLLMMAARVSQVSFNTLADGAQYALFKLNGFIDTIGGDDVARAFDRIQGAAVAVADGFRMAGDAVRWLDTNRQKILAFSDAILALTAVGAALAGGWPVAIGATLILLARHWDDVTAAVTRVKDTIGGLDDRFASVQGTLDSFSVLWASVRAGFRDFTEHVGPRIQPLMQRIEDAFIRAQPLISATVLVLGGFTKALLELAGPPAAGAIEVIGLITESMGRAAHGAAVAAEQILAAFVALFQPIADLAKKLRLPFADAFQSFIDGANNAKNRINTSMSQVKTDLARAEITRLQQKVNSLKGKKVKTEADRRAIADSEARIRELQRRINSLHGKTVHAYVITHQMLDPVHRGGERSSSGRAAGGPVEKGRPYIVGEHRREVFIPRETGRIENKVPAGWDGGGRSQPMVLQIVSGGSREDDYLVEKIRRAVRVKGGGNVQVAFGR
jgi:hypothetical protein